VTAAPRGGTQGTTELATRLLLIAFAHHPYQSRRSGGYKHTERLSDRSSLLGESCDAFLWRGQGK
jgi:hypothetical protein